MRGYIAFTPDELAELIQDGEISVETAFVPTRLFKAANSELGEEESEYILSLLAADDSLSFQGEGAKFSFALAVDLEDTQIGDELDVEVNGAAKLGGSAGRDATNFREPRRLGFVRGVEYI